MIHIRRGGSNGTTKDKDERFVPVHPVISQFLGPARKKIGPIFKVVTERKLLKRLKQLCEECEFENPHQYKLHSFRHHFASICANNHVAYRKALAWLGHSSSEMLDLYYHLHDEDSQHAMRALASLRAKGQSKIEKTLQLPQAKELVTTMSNITERAGFEPAVPAKGTPVFETGSFSHSDTSPISCIRRT